MKGKGFFTRRTLSNLAIVCIGVLLYMALANIQAIRDSLGWFFGIFKPFFVGVIMAYLFNMPVSYVENKFFRNLRYKRGISILVVVVLTILVITLLLGMVIPQLIQSIITLVRNIPGYLENLNSFFLWIDNKFEVNPTILDRLLVPYTDLINQIANWIKDALPELLNMTVKFGSGVVGVFTALIASIYMLFSKEKLLVQCKRVLYAIFPKTHADECMRVFGISNKIFSGFIGGKLADSAIIGVICFVVMTITNAFFIEMPFALLISVIIGVTNIIPFFGPFIGAVPSVMILLLVNPLSAVWFIVFIIILQQFDGNILGPKILGESTGLPALWVLIAIIVGGGLFGFIGMVLGVPTTAVLYILASEIVEKQLQKKGLPGFARKKTAAEGPENTEQQDHPPDNPPLSPEE